MKELIVTDKQTIESIKDNVRWINSQMETFTQYLKRQNFNQDINENIDIYSNHIITSCDIINNLLEIE